MQGKAGKKKQLKQNTGLRIRAKVGPNSGEGKGTPLQYSSLENPMDGGAW